MNRRNFFKVLNIQETATEEEIKNAYRKLVKKYHPDLSGNKKSSDRFLEINHAYKNLIVNEKPRTLVDFPVKNSPIGKKSSNPWKNYDVFALGKLLTSGKSLSIRVFAARGLGNSGKKSAYAFLRKALYDKNEIVVKTAVDAIGSLQIYQAAGELGAVFVRGNKKTKEAVLKAVERMNNHEAFQNILLSGMQDSNPHIRRKALQLFLTGRNHG